MVDRAIRNLGLDHLDTGWVINHADTPQAVTAYAKATLRSAFRRDTALGRTKGRCPVRRGARGAPATDIQRRSRAATICEFRLWFAQTLWAPRHAGTLLLRGFLRFATWDEWRVSLGGFVNTFADAALAARFLPKEVAPNNGAFHKPLDLELQFSGGKFKTLASCPWPNAFFAESCGGFHLRAITGGIRGGPLVRSIPENG